ncbi:DUF6233 domain-containing protein (plasmid) [Streptomyces sp. NBC_00876]|uniref:hypothetical protein n=1 Tax=Streptomyces sp. NBC_00876 TaxID=2975853 RepID=UPI002F9128DA|nr:DUF6233 domain-containing protein [Streptomyces sp. NBC_00876]
MSREDAVIALDERDVEPCPICLPDSGLPPRMTPSSAGATPITRPTSPSSTPPTGSGSRTTR